MLGWKKLGLEQCLGSRIVTYADDLVILCKKGNADQALQQLRKIMSKLKQNTNDLRIGVYITSVPASEGLWSSVRNVETTLIEPRPLAIRSGAYRSDAGRRG